VFYPKKIREAWKNGEDPTDWRADLEKETRRKKEE